VPWEHEEMAQSILAGRLVIGFSGGDVCRETVARSSPHGREFSAHEMTGA
jgi:hypothetical protein